MTTPCPNNVANHTNGCSCRKRVSTQAEASVADVALVDRSHDPVPVPVPARPYVLLDEPEISHYANRTTVTNRVAEPITSEDGIAGYGGVCGPTRMNVPDDAPGVPGPGHHFSGGVGPAAFEDHMRVTGWARSHAEGWDRLGEHQRTWAERFDLRPSTLKTRVTYGSDDEALSARAQRLASADRLNAAVAARKALPARAVLPGKRRQIAQADAEIQAAWADYQVQYPDV